jgi:hypothetical protein
LSLLGGCQGFTPLACSLLRHAVIGELPCHLHMDSKVRCRGLSDIAAKELQRPGLPSDG